MLEGEELAEAVALKQGWQRLTHGWWRDGYRAHCIGASKALQHRYRPDLSIAQAWDLDGEGWDWDFSENIPDAGWLEIILCETGHEDGIIIIHTDMQLFPTKAEAYATARCRAYLKGMEVT